MLFNLYYSLRSLKLAQFLLLRFLDRLNFLYNLLSDILPLVVTQYYIDFVHVTNLEFHLFAVAPARAFNLIIQVENLCILTLICNFMYLRTILVRLVVLFKTQRPRIRHGVSLILQELIICLFVVFLLCIASNEPTPLFFTFIMKTFLFCIVCQL